MVGAGNRRRVELVIFGKRGIATTTLTTFKLTVEVTKENNRERRESDSEV